MDRILVALAQPARQKCMKLVPLSQKWISQPKILKFAPAQPGILLSGDFLFSRGALRGLTTLFHVTSVKPTASTSGPRTVPAPVLPPFYRLVWRRP